MSILHYFEVQKFNYTADDSFIQSRSLIKGAFRVEVMVVRDVGIFRIIDYIVMRFMINYLRKVN